MDSLKGVFTALVTPFTSNGELDEEGLTELLEIQIQSQVDGICVIGSTGESPTLNTQEKLRIIKIARNKIPASTVLMVGTGSNNTAQAIFDTKEAEKMGADMALVICPYYNRPTQEGLFQHFKAIAAATSLPIVIYNHPGRTGQNLHTSTLRRLANIPSIIGVKETSGNIEQISDVIELIRSHRPDFSVMSGDDGLTLPLMALGGQGVISVVSNLIPKEIKTFVDYLTAGNYKEGQKLHYKLQPLLRAIFCESNPIPIKAALQLCDLPSGGCRLPLCNLQPENLERLKSVLSSLEFKTPLPIGLN